MKKVTLESAKKEGIHSLLNAAGVVGGAILMKLASAYVNPWLVPAVGIGAGYFARIAGNDEVKEIGSGVMAAGTIVLTKKGLDTLSAKVPMLSKFSENIPTLAGGEMSMQTIDARALRGAGAYADAEVVSTRLLR